MRVAVRFWAAFVVALSTSVVLADCPPAIAYPAGKLYFDGSQLTCLGSPGRTGTLRIGQTQILQVSSHFIFADYTKKQFQDTCNHDSGGPLVCSSGVVGLTSDGTGSSCGGPEISSYANLQNESILAFLRSTVPDVVVE